MNTNNKIKLLIDFGLQPISNRYLTNPKDQEKLFPLKLGQCQNTGLIQLIEPVPFDELVPRYDWITYMEPEDHLDDLVERIKYYLPTNKSLKIGGVSFKDDPILKRFEKMSNKIWKIDLKHDLSLDNHLGIESIQAAINKNVVDKIVKQNGKSDFLIARHIFEHVYNIGSFLESLKSLIYDDGYILFEIPDSTTSLQSNDYTMTWEEHIIYLTPYTFKYLLRYHGFNIVFYHEYPSPHENLLVVLVSKNKADHDKTLNRGLDNEISLGDKYSEYFNKIKNRIHDFLKIEKEHGKIALFGAGQDTIAFVNYLKNSEFFDCVIDDNKNKNGLFMPKSALPIVGSNVLSDNDHKLCLLSLNPINEDKVVNKLRNEIGFNGKIYSIFPHSNIHF